MAINKNFVVKNGLEVAADVIVADAVTKKVGIGTTVGQLTLDVRGSIGATDLSVTGIGTIVTIRNTFLNTTSGIVTNLAGVAATITNLNTTNLTGTNANFSGIVTATSLNVIGGITSIASLNVSGISTLGTVQISTGIITATSGIVTYYGDGQYLTGLPGNPTLQTVLSTGNTSTIGMSISGVSTLTTLDSTNLTGTNANFSGIVTASGGFNIGIQSGGVNVTTGVITAINFIGAGNTFLYNSSTKTVNISISGGGGGSLSISTSTASVVQDIAFVGGAGTSVIGISTTTDRFVYLPSTGSVGVGTSIPTSKLHVIGDVLVSGIITCTDINSTSDAKLKTNVHTVENALDIVNNLRGVSFDWKESGKSSYGIIAQELEEVLPDLVSNTDPKTVNYNGIIGVLIEAIKELKAEIEELKNS